VKTSKKGDIHLFQIKVDVTFFLPELARSAPDWECKGRAVFSNGQCGFSRVRCASLAVMAQRLPGSGGH
jgi:hypothetical protein